MQKGVIILSDEKARREVVWERNRENSYFCQLRGEGRLFMMITLKIARKTGNIPKQSQAFEFKNLTNHKLLTSYIPMGSFGASTLSALSIRSALRREY